MNFDEDHWLAYREANLRFAEAVRSQLRDGDMVWVQDYHLMLLPMLLRGLLNEKSTSKSANDDIAKVLANVGNPEQELEFVNPVVKDIKIGFFSSTPQGGE